MTLQNPLNWWYIFGLFEADGSFHITFHVDKRSYCGYKVRPEFSISQKDVALLKRLQTFFQEHRITTHLKLSTNQATHRAAALRGEGIINTRLFLQKIQDCRACFYSIKAHDLQTMKHLFLMIDENQHNTSQGRKVVIDLKYSLHHPTPLEKETLQLYKQCFPRCALGFIERDDPTTHIIIPPSNRLPREVWEERHNLSTGDSRGAAEKTLDGFHREYNIVSRLFLQRLHGLQMKKSLGPWNPAANDFLEENQRLHPSFVAGLFDGDGSISKGQPCISLCLESGSQLLFVVLHMQWNQTNFVMHSIKNKNAVITTFYARVIRDYMCKILKEEHFCIKKEAYQQLIAKVAKMK